MPLAMRQASAAGDYPRGANVPTSEVMAPSNQRIIVFGMLRSPAVPVGELLRKWRERRRMSQLALAVDADVSSKHVSFVESGRAMPSRELLLTLSDVLAVPLRARNALLLAAGFAPSYPEHSLDSPELASARNAVELLLRAQEPFPALALDRHWNLVAHNRAVLALLEGASPALLVPPVNVARLSLHPQGLSGKIANFPEWRAHLGRRMFEQVEASADATLTALYDELFAGERIKHAPADLVTTLRLRQGDAELTLLSTTTIFGSPLDITLSELAIETFLPANDATAEALRALCPR